MRITFKPVFRWDNNGKIFRIFRCGWNKEKIGHARYLQAKLSFALTPRLFFFKKECCNGVRLTVFGIRLHYAEFYSNGTFV